jgi:hypothetical protein
MKLSWFSMVASCLRQSKNAEFSAFFKSIAELIFLQSGRRGIRIKCLFFLMIESSSVRETRFDALREPARSVVVTRSKKY